MLEGQSEKRHRYGRAAHIRGVKHSHESHSVIWPCMVGCSIVAQQMLARGRRIHNARFAAITRSTLTSGRIELIMKKLGPFMATLCVTALISINTSLAQVPVPAAPATPAAAAPAAARPAAGAPAKAAKSARPNMSPRNAKSKECSMKADEQKLHGKARQKFCSECKKAA